MDYSRPERLVINHDNYYAKYVGFTEDGRQFFLTTPFIPPHKNNLGGEYLALYLFSASGKLLEAKIDALGPRKLVDKSKASQIKQARLDELGKITFGPIEIEPFCVKKWEIEFGLIAEEPSKEIDYWLINVMPGNYMTFYEPWDSGNYDT